MRTSFICDDLADVELRQDIHECLQVVENWNNANKDEGLHAAATGQLSLAHVTNRPLRHMSSRAR